MRKQALFTIAFTMIALAGCGDIQNQQDPNGGGISKPTDSDLSGTVGDFHGTFTGPCEYTANAVTATNCTATLQVQQEPTGIGFNLSYQIGMTSNSKGISYLVKGNSLLAWSGGSEPIGAIGNAGFRVGDNDLGQFTGKMNGDTLTITAWHLPNTLVSTIKPTGLVAVLKRSR